MDYPSNLPLGKKSPLPDEYDPSLLCPIERGQARESLGIEEPLPFVGYDVWHCYEACTLYGDGSILAGILKIVVPASSPRLIESKSMKLYLCSFHNQSCGTYRDEARDTYLATIYRDVSAAVGDDISVNLFDLCTHRWPLSLDGGVSYVTHLLRTRCPVTGQPDFASVYIDGATHDPWPLIASLRDGAHFHEQICEQLYCQLAFGKQPWPEELAVSCLFTRRGGIDICPCRASHVELLPQDLVSAEVLTTLGPRS